MTQFTMSRPLTGDEIQVLRILRATIEEFGILAPAGDESIDPDAALKSNTLALIDKLIAFHSPGAATSARSRAALRGVGIVPPEQRAAWREQFALPGLLRERNGEVIIALLDELDLADARLVVEVEAELADFEAQRVAALLDPALHARVAEAERRLHALESRLGTPDVFAVPLTAEDFDLLEEALDLTFQKSANEGLRDQIAELRDRLKRARLLP